ncbi:unnamed protein product [Paramecium sonneborni]|uniref:Transmembrane protein n=1 Tax=Paramecium sonneborni TaxID=65129 RepID=A0A8S1P1U9_9CILI|nr:unnamed protein product [Paramecium sonneborni]
MNHKPKLHSFDYTISTKYRFCNKFQQCLKLNKIDEKQQKQCLLKNKDNVDLIIRIYFKMTIIMGLRMMKNLMEMVVRTETNIELYGEQTEDINYSNVKQNNINVNIHLLYIIKIKIFIYLSVSFLFFDQNQSPFLLSNTTIIIFKLNHIIEKCFGYSKGLIIYH